MQRSLQILIFFDFDGPEYGLADSICTPPLFNRPGYAAQSSASVQLPTRCKEGGPDSFGNDSFLTALYSSSPGQSNEIRFSWIDPQDEWSWARVVTRSLWQGNPTYQNPVVHIAIGGRISMKLAMYAEDATETPVPGAELEVALCIREIEDNLPLGSDGRTWGDVEFIGLDDFVQTQEYPYREKPVGGIRLTSSSRDHFRTLTWEILDPRHVAVSVGGGTPIVKPVVGFSYTANGYLWSPHQRGTLDSLIFIKPDNDTTTKKWFINVDDVVIESADIPNPDPEPVQIRAPILVYSHAVTVEGISPVADELRLHWGRGQVLSAPAPEGGFAGGTYTFSRVPMSEGVTFSATQLVSEVESPHSNYVTVVSNTLDDFVSIEHADQPNGYTWYPIRNDAHTDALPANLNGNPAMLLHDEDGTNGVYRVFPAVIPYTGTFEVSARILITEDPAHPDSIRQFQIGAVVNGEHRNPSACHGGALAAVNGAAAGSTVASVAGLTPALDVGLLMQTVTTGPFSAEAGDDLLIVLSTNVETRWQDTSLEPGADGIPGTTDDALDLEDACESTDNSQERSPQLTEQGTFNLLPDRTETSNVWGSAARIYIDDLRLETSCCLPDQDGDIWVNSDDNCPSVNNPDQADADGDGVGDACDACPNTPAGSTSDPEGCAPGERFDLNHDGLVDSADSSLFSICATGATIPHQPGCEDRDFDEDGDIDQEDFGVLQRCFSGADPLDPNCAD